MQSLSQKGKEMSRNRLVEAVDSQELDPNSLVGSFFHGTSEQGIQGCIVAQVHPQVYLCELFDWFAGHSSYQKLYKLEDMLGWQFYDTAEWMKNEYEHGGLMRRWEYEREQKRAAS